MLECVRSEWCVLSSAWNVINHPDTKWASLRMRRYAWHAKARLKSLSWKIELSDDVSRKVETFPGTPTKPILVSWHATSARDPSSSRPLHWLCSRISQKAKVTYRAKLGPIWRSSSKIYTSIAKERKGWSMTSSNRRGEERFPFVVGPFQMHHRNVVRGLSFGSPKGLEKRFALKFRFIS